MRISDWSSDVCSSDLKPRWKTIEHYVCFDNGEFEDLIAAESDDYAWVEGDEREPAMLCYTSGTTSDPKGVLYEHRSTVLHALEIGRASCRERVCQYV